jgi:MFS family permease
MKEFKSDNASLSSLLISIYSIGLAVGPLLLSPMSEIYGRTPLMHASNLMFLLSAVLCAVSVNIPMLLVFRLVMGASNTALGGGYVADLMAPEHRGRAMNVWTVGPVLVRRSLVKSNEC